MTKKELFHCEYCGKDYPGRISLNIQTEGQGANESVWGESTYGLCTNCFKRWFDGFPSTKRLIYICEKRRKREDLIKK